MLDPFEPLEIPIIDIAIPIGPLLLDIGAFTKMLLEDDHDVH